MRLEALELVEGRERRVLIVQMHDEADGDEIVVEMVEEGAAARAVVERPAEGMLDAALVEFLRLDLPEFLQADAVFLRLAPLVESELPDGDLGERAACSLAQQRVAAAQLHAAGEALGDRAVLGDAHIASGD